MDHYIRLQDQPDPSPKQPDNKKLIIGYTCQFILYALTITYCILSPSLFSTISLAFVLISFIFMLATPYAILHIPPKSDSDNKDGKTNTNQSDMHKQCCAVSYRVELYIMSTFTLANIAIFLYKIYVCINPAYKEGLSQAELGFYQIQDNLHSFLPLILLPFCVGACFVETKSQPVKNYQKKFNEMFAIPIFLIVGGLIVLIQIFSISVIGFFFFCVMIALLTQKTNFTNQYSWILMIVVQILTFGGIIGNFITTTQFLKQDTEIKGGYKFWGINALNDFKIFSVDQGYYFCLIFLFLIAAYMLRIFEYNRIWTLCNNKFSMGQIKQKDLFMEQGIEVDQNWKSRIGSRRDSQNIQEVENDKKNKNKVQAFSLRQFEMQSLSDNRNSREEDNEIFENHAQQTKRRNATEGYKDSNSNRIESQSHHSGEQEAYRRRKSSLRNQLVSQASAFGTKGSRHRKYSSMQFTSQAKPGKLKQILDFLVLMSNKLVIFLNGTEFTLRMTEVISIIVISRYNNIYSFVAVVWLASVASIQRIRVIYLITFIALLPIQLVNFTIMYGYNMPESPFGGLQNKSIYGFQKMELFWLDIIIFNVYFFYIIAYLLAASKDGRKTFKRSTKVLNPQIWVFFVAFIFRYSYLLTIIAIFFLGFSEVNLINLVYVIIFLVFFSSGENVLIETKKNHVNGEKKQYVSLTTFSRKYWFLIVYYTLGCIICKYIYFLFFAPDTISPDNPLAPTGINKEYHWDFNFSLSSHCLSNTTPFFLIFLLSESQIIIYRSPIYLNYSFSLMKQVSEHTTPGAGNKRSILRRSRKFLNTLVEITLEFYYQSLYYITGIIILLCSFRWNIPGLVIIIFTCYGILKGFNRKIIAFIVFLDLAFIITNYAALFLFFPSIQQFFGQSLVQFLYKTSLFIGLLMQDQTQLWDVFALNIVIFYFSVQSYRLEGILQENRFDQEGRMFLNDNNQEGEQSSLSEEHSQNNQQNFNDQSGDNSHSSVYSYQKKGREPYGEKMRRSVSDTISGFSQTVIQSEYEDIQFAKNYNKGVILLTKKLYMTNLWKKYTWWAYFCRVISLFITDIALIVVLICCLYFRLAISMFVFLAVYLIYYFFLFDKIGNFLKQVEFYQRINREYQSFRAKQEHLSYKSSEEERSYSFITGDQATQSCLNFIKETRQQTFQMRFRWKQKISFITSTLSVLLLVLTYSAQFLSSQFYDRYINTSPGAQSNTQFLQNFLFVVGISATKNQTFFRQAYFYYLMVFVALCEKLLLKYIIYQKGQQNIEESIEMKSQLKMREYRKLQDPQKFIDQELSQFLVEDYQVFNERALDSVYNKISQYSQSSSSSSQKQPKDQKIQDSQHTSFSHQQFHKQANLLIYFQYKQSLIKINFLTGIMMMMLRFYLLMMLINLYEKSNAFAFAYLFAVLFFWFSPLHFGMVTNINKIAIVILLVQYLALLCDINEQTSSLLLPYPGDNLSLLQRIMPDKWVDYLVVDFDADSSNISSFFVSFIISSIIIFLTELYFTLYFIVSRITISYISQIYQRYQYITLTLKSMPKKDTIYLNYENYKNSFYRFINLSYELLINNSYIVVSMLCLMLLANVHNYISVGLVIFACIYIYLGIFTAFSEDKNIYTYTELFFKIVRGILFFILFLVTAASIPIFKQGEDTGVIAYIQSLSNLSQVFLLFFIQLWLDLAKSDEFKEKTVGYNLKVKNREDALIKVIAYQENSDLILRMIKRYKEVMWFEVNLKDALDIIDQWHKAMYKDNIPQFESLRSKIAPVNMENIKQQMREQFARRPQEDQSIIQKIKNYMNLHTNISVRYRYYEIMRYIVYCNHRILDLNNCSIDIWDYVLENYSTLNQQIREADENLDKIIEAVQNQEYGDRIQKLESIKNEQFSQVDRDIDVTILGKIRTPQKIFLDIQGVSSPISQLSSSSASPASMLDEKSFFKSFINFILSNFSYVLSFFIWIYYLINPCLLSLPFIVYFFSFEIISDKKLTSIMLLYIFSIIILALVVQIEGISSKQWVKYFFYEPEQGSHEYLFAVGYLFFIFVLIFINEEIKKYQGNKFRYYHEAENRLQGVIRILINCDSNSELNLWKMRVDEDYEQKQCNPMNHFSQIIQNHPQHITEYPETGFFQSFTDGKTGIDLYPLIASVQIFLTIYLIFFYPFMVETSNTSLDQSFKYFQFSSDMVIAVLSHVLSIVLERWITLIGHENKKKEKIKYFYTMFLLALFLIFIYFIAPINTTIKDVYHPRGFLIAFSFFYFFYFFLSGLQIRFGYKKYKSLNSIMSRRRMFNNIIVIGFNAVPFLFQLKLMMDWAFCETSLKIFDWFRLVNIYYSAFKAKMQYYSSTGVVLGNPMNWIMKSVGWLGFIGILIVIFGPMILFSGLNPIAQSNLVTGGSLELGIQIQDGNYFTLYQTSHFSNPPLTFNSSLFYQMNFQQVPLLQTLTSKDIENQFQYVSYQPYSDTNWGISLPNLQILLETLNKTISQMQSNSSKIDHQFSIIVKYQLDRSVSSTIATQTNFAYPPQTNQYLGLNELKSLMKTFTQCGQSTYFQNFYIDLIRLNTIGSSYKPRPIIFVNSSGINPYLQGVNLTLFCDSTNSTFQTNNAYWGLFSSNSSDAQKQKNEGISLYVLCDKYQNLIGGLGFTALYTSVILVVANMIRGVFAGNLPQIPYFQNPKSDSIIQICEAIGTLRTRKQYRDEYLMYYELIDIIRSPDLMKYLSGSFPKLIQAADEKKKRKAKQQQQQALKNKIQ